MYIQKRFMHDETETNVVTKYDTMKQKNEQNVSCLLSFLTSKEQKANLKKA